MLLVMILKSINYMILGSLTENDADKKKVAG